MHKKLIAAAALAAMTWAPQAAAQKKVVLKFAIFTPAKERTFVQVMKPFAERVMADSNGTLVIKLFPNGGLGRHPGKQLKMVQDGVADIAWVIPAYTPGRFKDNSVFELPNIIQNATEGSVAAWRMLQKGKLRGYGGFKMLSLFTTAPYTFHTNFKVTKPGDLLGKKIRAVGPNMVASVKAIGAVPEPMSFTKIVEAISRGRITGTTAHPIALHDFGIAKVTNSHYFARLGTVNLAFFMNKKKFDGLPNAAKAALNKHSGEALSRAFGKMSDERNAELREIWSRDKSRTVTVPTAGANRDWDAQLRPVLLKWVANHKKGSELLKALRAELAGIRAGK